MLPPQLQDMANHKQFILWKITERQGKPIKLPVNPHTLGACEVTDVSAYMTYDDALAVSEVTGLSVGFVFSENDPYFFLDIDKCKNPDGTWTELATTLVDGLPGCAVELSQSGTGLHVFGTVSAGVDHRCKNIPLGIELYTEKRFVALTGNLAWELGDIRTVTDITPLVNTYFPPKRYATDLDWTSEPVEGYTLDCDDDELVDRALRAQSASAAFGGSASFRALWEADVDILAKFWPSSTDDSYDRSSADMALANHLAYWTGRDCERMRRLMDMSALKREKWEREDYIQETILGAARMVTKVYDVTRGDASVAQEFGGSELSGKSDAQINYAEKIRAEKINSTVDMTVKEALASGVGALSQAGFWLNNMDAKPEELISIAEDRTGYQLLTAIEQKEDYFKGFVYVVGQNRVFCPEYGLINKDQFNARYSRGYEFNLDHTGDRKPTRKAWDAFLNNSAFIAPVASQTCFRPDLETGSIVSIAGVVCVNVYTPTETLRVKGDASPFLGHMSRLLPDPRDREILLSYMAALVQYKGRKFFWAPLIQGVEGNGKSLIVDCLTYAIGERYTHKPLPNELTEKYNSWLFNKIFIAIEEIKVSQEKKVTMEILKPMITDKRHSCRAMQQDQTMMDNRANFVLVSNHKDAIFKTYNDRRYAILYTAQQDARDLKIYRMQDGYFQSLYKWLDDGGYAIVNDFLHCYQIAPEFNPAAGCTRAPVTSSTDEAVNTSLGPLEQMVLEAVESGVAGFQGGWVSSHAVYTLFESAGRRLAVPYKKLNDFMKNIGYVLHPTLTGGRTNHRVPGMLDGNKKVRLYVREHSSEQMIQSQAEAVDSYLRAQET